MTVRNILMWMLAVSLVLAGCTTIQPIQPPSSDFQPPIGDSQSSSDAPGPWAPNEIILFGADEDIQKVLQELPDGLLELEPQRGSGKDITPLINELLEQPEKSQGLFREYLGLSNFNLEAIQGKEFSIRLYRVSKNMEVLEVIELINSIRDSIDEEKSLFVFAEPNFIFVSSQNAPGTCTYQGQPNSFGNGPFGGAVYSAGGLSEFNDQWAFQRLAGIPETDPPISDPVENNVSSAGVEPVDVLIFDTSPFTDIADTNDVLNGISQAIGTGPTQITLELWHWPFSAPKLNEHGVMVTSLIHKISPNSTIKLVRVLDNLGCGTSFELLEAMSDFLTYYFRRDQTVVINLSLVANNNFKQPSTLGALIILSSLKKILVVAAAGNGKRPELSLPASLVDDTNFPNSNLIAVEASNFHSVQACFTNRGTNSVWAPGGEGSNPSTCSANLGNCADEATCDNAIMGRTHDDRLAFWFGTSFAAPLVSGAAARWLSQGCSVAKVYNHLITNYKQSVVNLTSPTLSCP